MVKILMVHGFGVNAEIFEAQTAPVRALLPSHWEYHFLQGPLECGPAPGIGEIYPGQTYNCWFFVPSLIEFQSVHEYLEEVIEDEGPFDAAWGFSAGAMIIGSLMLRYAHEKSHIPPPFRAAIFQNCYMPWSATFDLGKDVTPLIIHHQNIPTTAAEADRLLEAEHAKNSTKATMLSDERNANWEAGELMSPMMRFAYQKIHEQDVEGGVQRDYDDYRSHRMFPEVDKVRIEVPSAHILGAKDPLYELSVRMCEMSDPKVSLKYEHGFGHEFPVKSQRDMRKLGEVIEKTIIRADFA